MSHTSPSSYLVWSIISSLLGCFLLYHLWSFDKFKCLRWGPHSGAFKRIMTYTYLLSVPLIMAFAIGFTIIKYHEGYILHPTLGVIPKPWNMWGARAQKTLLPLLLMFSVAWSLEMVTHLEELCFWLFLVNAGSTQQDWFKSWYFRIWVVGSACAVIYMPLVTVFTRQDPLKSEAFTYLAGSLGSLSLTLWFLPILWTFPTFLDTLKSEGVERTTIIRLTKFHELNSIRVIFRFLFTIPLVILGCDGVRPHRHINESVLWTDTLATIAAFGVAISSGITLVIFFPRSIEHEMAAKEHRGSSSPITPSFDYDQRSIYSSRGRYLLTSSPIKETFAPLPNQDGRLHDQRRYSAGSDMMASVDYEDERRDEMSEIPFRPLNMRPNRFTGSRVELGSLGMGGGVASSASSRIETSSARLSTVNPVVHGFTSPIDFSYQPKSTLQFPNNNSRLTFTPR